MHLTNNASNFSYSKGLRNISFILCSDLGLNVRNKNVFNPYGSKCESQVAQMCDDLLLYGSIHLEQYTLSVQQYTLGVYSSILQVYTAVRKVTLVMFTYIRS